LELIFAYATVRRVGASVHLKGLSDGTSSNLNGASLVDSLSVATMAIPNPLSKCSEESSTIVKTAAPLKALFFSPNT
jgi:hypothetical protein